MDTGEIGINVTEQRAKKVDVVGAVMREKCVPYIRLRGGPAALRAEK